MADVNITFLVEGGGGVAGGQEQGNDAGSKINKKASKNKETAKIAFSVNQAMNVAKRLSNEVIDGAITSYGETSGHTIQAEQIRKTKAYATKAVGLVASFAANWVVGLVDLGVQGVGEIINYNAEQRQIRWQNRQASELQRRAGFNANYNR